MDECSFDACGDIANNCTNTIGGYECSCGEGYTIQDEDTLQETCSGNISLQNNLLSE